MPYITEVDERIPSDDGGEQAADGAAESFFVGQISRHKGVDLLVEAFKAVVANNPNVMLHFIGAGTSETMRLD